jgi:flagellar basal-body rod protein FlgB
MKLFDSTVSTLERSLDVRLSRQNLLAGDLANANTPGYSPKDLNFREAMDAAQNASSSGAPPPPMDAFISESEGTPGLDGNRVDADHALVQLAQNAIQYGASARAVGKKLEILRAVADS